MFGLALAVSLATTSVPTPLRLPADVEDVYGLRYNPAGLASISGTELRLLYGRRLADDASIGRGTHELGFFGGVSLADGFAVAASLEGGQDDARRGVGRVGLGLGAKAGDVAFGFAWDRGHDDPMLPSRGVLSTGLIYQPATWLSSGISVRDLAQNADRRTYDLGLAVRPLGGDASATISARWRLRQSEPLNRDTLDLMFLASLEPIDGVRIGVASNLDAEVTAQLALSFDHLWMGASVTDMHADGRLGSGGLGSGGAGSSGVGGVGGSGGSGRGALDATISTELAYFSSPTPALFEPTQVAVLDLEGDLEPDASFSLTEQTFVAGTYGSAPLLLERLRTSHRVAGVFVRIGSLDIGWAKAEELRAGINALRAAGKRVDCQLGAARDLEYFVASSCTSVIVPPGLDLAVDGLAANVMFFGGALEELGVKVVAERRGAFKSAPEQFTRSEMSDAQALALGAYLDTVYETLVDGIVRGRRVARADVERLISEGTCTATEAQARSLVDEVIYPDEVDAYLAKTYRGRPIRFLRGASAIDPETSRWSSRPAVAVIHIDATIAGDTSRTLPFSLGRTAGARTVVDALNAAASDPGIVGVVLRVDSPGGEVLASDLIARAVAKLNEVKPVVASFGDVAASGGYYVASASRAIFAEPTTLTGSIGVFSVRFSAEALLGRLGISVGTLLRGERANSATWLRDPSAGDQAVLKRQVDVAYERFLGWVVRGRGLASKAEARTVAEGRIWSGADARTHQLVDTLGGLVDAIRAVKVEAGLDVNDEVDLTTLPATRAGLTRPLTLFRESLSDAFGQAIRGAFSDAFGEASSDAQSIPHVLRKALSVLGPWLVGLEGRERPQALVPYVVAVD
ncbi:MAG: signal peptide peptidase SppA [Deltaproteobacteria bacterium]|nr:signal peptide peptidase SppA [Deltaproteobacteria bacterium]